MDKQKAIEKARVLVSQKPKPNELDPAETENLLESLGLENKGKNSDHTTYRYYHKHLEKDSDYFKYGILSVSVHHAKGQKKRILVGSVRKIIRALELYLEEEDVKK